MFLLFFRLANHVEVGGEIHFLEFFINVLVVFGAYYNFVDVPSSKFVDEAVYWNVVLVLDVVCGEFLFYFLVLGFGKGGVDDADVYLADFVEAGGFAAHNTSL